MENTRQELSSKPLHNINNVSAINGLSQSKRAIMINNRTIVATQSRIAAWLKLQKIRLHIFIYIYTVKD
jgi:hypothetical protein